MGQLYTLADGDIKISWIKSLALLIHQSVFFHFRQRNLNSTRRINNLIKAVDIKWARNINWLLSSEKIFPVKSNKKYWKESVIRLTAKSDIILFDLSEEISKYLTWELEHCRNNQYLNKTYFLSEEYNIESNKAQLHKIWQNKRLDSHVFENETALFNNLVSKLDEIPVKKSSASILNSLTTAFRMFFIMFFLTLWITPVIIHQNSLIVSNINSFIGPIYSKGVEAKLGQMNFSQHENLNFDPLLADHKVFDLFLSDGDFFNIYDSAALPILEEKINDNVYTSIKILNFIINLENELDDQHWTSCTDRDNQKCNFFSQPEALVYFINSMDENFVKRHAPKYPNVFQDFLVGGIRENINDLTPYYSKILSIISVLDSKDTSQIKDIINSKNH